MKQPPAHAELRPVPGRMGIGINVAVQILVSLLIFGAINFLSYRYYARWDLSPTRDHTLSSSTLNYLRKLTKDVEITVALPRQSEIFEDARTLVEEYRRNGKKLVRTELIDPARDAARAEQLKLEAGISLSEGGILLRSSSRSRFIPESEILIKVKTPNSETPVVFFRGEDAITSALIGLVEGRTRKFYLISGKGGVSNTSSEEGFLALKEIGLQQNFEVLQLNLSEVQEIPGDASGVLIIGASYDLSEREMKMLESYWSAKGAGLMFLLDPQAEVPRIHGFLSTFGVTPRDDRVLVSAVTSAGPEKRFEVQGVFSKETIITRHLASASIILAGQTQSLNLKQDDKALAEQSVVVIPLIDAAPRFWGETQYLEPLPIADEADTKPPVHIATAVERGASLDQRVGVDSSRMVVVGNSMLLDRKSEFAVNRDFVAASLNWMINRERLIGSPPKQKGSYRIDISDDQHKYLFWIAALFMPLTVLALGFLIWAGRRSS